MAPSRLFPSWFGRVLRIKLSLNQLEVTALMQSKVRRADIHNDTELQPDRHLLVDLFK